LKLLIFHVSTPPSTPPGTAAPDLPADANEATTGSSTKKKKKKSEEDESAVKSVFQQYRDAATKVANNESFEEMVGNFVENSEREKFRYRMDLGAKSEETLWEERVAVIRVRIGGLLLRQYLTTNIWMIGFFLIFGY
jgi:hypothetical protein